MSSAARNVLARGRLSRCALLTLGVFVLLGFGSSVSASAEPSELPTYNGGGFTAIKGPSDPEEYSWVVSLGEDQELRQIDERTAAVYYTDGVHVAFGISAGAAHDAEGSSVPTTLVVSGADVVTRIIHHRAGNPSAGGVSFVYPVTDGAGWEGGFHTIYVDMPDESLPDELAGQTAPGCVVPDLKGWSLKADRKKLKRAGCTLGKVRGQRSRTARIVRQDLGTGTVLPAGASVSVKLG